MIDVRDSPSRSPSVQPLRTVAGVASLGLGLGGEACTGARMDLRGLLDDIAVFDQLPDVLPYAQARSIECLVEPSSSSSVCHAQ